MVMKDTMQAIQNSHQRQFLEADCFVVKKSHIIYYRQ